MSLLERNSGRRSPLSVSSASTRSSQRRKPTGGHVGQASWISSVVNLVNTIVGAGLLAMPSAISHMGIVPGLIFLIWAGLTSGFGLYLQTRCARYLDPGNASFFALAQLTYPKASIVFDGAIAIKCFGVGVSYLIIIGDLMPGVVQGLNNDPNRAAFLTDRRFWITAFMLVVIPFSFLRRLDSLKYTSVVALISIAYLTILVLFHFFSGDTVSEKGHINVWHWAGPVQFLSSLPIMIFGYTCHQNMFSVLNEMSNPAPVQTTSVIFASIGTAASLYALVAVTGYLSFGDNVTGNIVSMYHSSVASTIGKAAIVVLVMFSYALQVHPCRASVDAVLKWRPGNSNAASASRDSDASPSRAPPARSDHGGSDGMSESRFALITSVIVILSYIVAMSVTSLDRVLAYVGSTGSTSISFILPGIFYYKVSAPESPHHQRLLKDDEDAQHNDIEEGEDEEEAEESNGLLGQAAHAGRRWRVKWNTTKRKFGLRQSALGLAIYGGVVMAVCLGMNLFFTVAH